MAAVANEPLCLDRCWDGAGGPSESEEVESSSAWMARGTAGMRRLGQAVNPSQWCTD